MSDVGEKLKAVVDAISDGAAERMAGQLDQVAKRAEHSYQSLTVDIRSGNEKLLERHVRVLERTLLRVTLDAAGIGVKLDEMTTERAESEENFQRCREASEAARQAFQKVILDANAKAEEFKTFLEASEEAKQRGLKREQRLKLQFKRAVSRRRVKRD